MLRQLEIVDKKVTRPISTCGYLPRTPSWLLLLTCVDKFQDGTTLNIQQHHKLPPFKLRLCGPFNRDAAVKHCVSREPPSAVKFSRN
jgi:hypothetical protein